MFMYYCVQINFLLPISNIDSFIGLRAAKFLLVAVGRAVRKDIENDEDYFID